MYLEVEHTARDEIILESVLVDMILVKHVVEDRTTLKESRKSGECNFTHKTRERIHQVHVKD